MTAESNTIEVAAEPISRPDITQSGPSAGDPAREQADCAAMLKSLYDAVVAERPDDRYMWLHSRPTSIRRNVETFFKFRKYLPKAGVILDWGCKHAPDACLARHVLGDEVRLLGCDFDRGESHRRFHEFSRIEFTPITHVYKLDYPDESVDVVIAGGVLEHVALPGESLKELYRILKPHGTLIITFLPNRLSYTEALGRLFRKEGHRRLYSLRFARQLLLHHGFDPQVARYHQFIPAQRAAPITRRLWFLNGFLEDLWPINRFSANIMLVAIKRLAI